MELERRYTALVGFAELIMIMTMKYSTGFVGSLGWW